MDQSKTIFASKTFWGAMLSGASALACGLFGFEIVPAEAEAAAHVLAGLGAAIGALVTLYGRWVARARIRA